MQIRPGCTLIAAMVVWLVTVPAAQSGAGNQAKGTAPAPKKSPFLKLVEPWPEDNVVQARRAEADTRRLFQGLDPLALTLTADFKAINKDRNPVSTKRFSAVLSVAGESGATRALPVKLGTRGHFRLMARNCEFVRARQRIIWRGSSGRSTSPTRSRSSSSTAARPPLRCNQHWEARTVQMQPRKHEDTKDHEKELSSSWFFVCFVTSRSRYASRSGAAAPRHDGGAPNS